MKQISIKETFLCASPLAFVLTLVAPLSFYFGNRAEYVVNLGDVLWILFSAFIATLSLLALLLRVVARWPRLYRVCCGILLGLAVSAWVQSQLLAWNFGPLDGRGIAWSNWTLHANMELVLWLGVSALAAVASLRGGLVVGGVAPGLLLLGALSLGAAWIGAGPAPKKVERVVGHAEQEIFSFDRQRNTLLIVLDTFQGDAFEEISRRWPADVAFLKGFSFYPNALGGYPTTQASIPLILTGRFYRNEVPVREWIAANSAASNIADYYMAHGYSSALASEAPSTLLGVKAPTVPMASVSMDGRAEQRQALMVLDGGLFRASPTWLKPRLYGEGDWFFSRLILGNKLPPGSHGVDAGFLMRFERDSRVAQFDHGAFRFYHYSAAHLPLRVNEHFEYEENMPGTREAYLRQARGALSLLRRMLDRLKELKVYDSAEIMVVGDHGTSMFPPVDLRNKDELPDSDVNGSVLSSARPLFLHKPASASGGLAVSDQPVHLAQVACLLSGNASVFGCDAAGQGNERARHFLYYNWSKEYWGWTKKYMPPMTEFIVRGDVRDVRSWEATYKGFAEGSSRTLPRAAAYNMGESILFAQGGNSSQYQRGGWSSLEPGHCWTEGPRSHLRFDIGSQAGPLLLRLKASALPEKGGDGQDIEVLVNQGKVAHWRMTSLGWYEATIPANLLEGNILNLTFLIGNPTAPCEVGASSDCRSLGIAARELVIMHR